MTANPLLQETLDRLRRARAAKDVRVTCRLTDWQVERLEELSKKYGVGKSELIRTAVMALFDEYDRLEKGA